MKAQIKNWLLGLGFDAKDGHVRITQGRNFYLYGGSKETHQGMQEKAIRVNEELDRRSKTLNDVSVAEFREIAEKVGLKPTPSPLPPNRTDRRV